MTSIKKVISGLLVLTCVMSMNLLTVMANNETPTLNNAVTTVLGNSSFTWSHEAQGTSANAADGTYTKFEGGGATITATKTFNVDQEREFSIEIYAASSITHEALSDMKFKIDSGSEVTLTSENSEVSGLSNPCLTGDVWITKSIKYNTNITLDAGTHTLTITVPEESNNRTEAYFAFDCVRFVPVIEMVNVNKQDTTVFGNSSFIWNHTNKEENPNAADGTYTWFNGGGATITATKEFYVEEAGEYALEVYGASSITNGGLSDIQFKIDTSSAITLTSENSAVSELSNPCFAAEPWTVKKIEYNTNLLLDVGTHTITFIVPQESNNLWSALFIFDCAKLVPQDSEPEKEIVNVNKQDTAVLGNSLFTWNYNDTKTSANAADGTYTKFEGAGVTVTATATFNVEEAGEYSFELYAASSVTHEALSDIQFSIDDGSIVALTSENSAVRDLDNPCISEALWTTKSIRYNTNITLSAGTHTLTITVPQESNNRTEAYFVFDCARFIPPEPKQIITDSENVLEFEKFYPSYTLTSNGASGGFVVNILQYNATEHNIQMVFDVEKAGNYRFIMDASVEQGVSSPQFHLSPVFISVNGGAELEISNSRQDTFSVTSEALYECDWESSRITLAERIALAEGENTIVVRVPARQAGDMVVGTFDCIRLVRTKNIESITAGFGTGFIKRGESVPVSMQNQDGNAVTSGDFSQITYTSSNPDIAEVENGVLKAKNYGQTKITISAVANGQNLEAECEVNVVSENGIWLSSLEKTATGIKINISAIEDYSGGDSLLVGVYEQKEGMVTSLKSTVTQVTTSISGNSETDVEVSLSEYEDGDVVRVFLLDNSNLKRALYTKLTYGGVIE